MKPYTQIAIEKAKSGGYILSGDTFFVIDNQKNTVKNAYGEGSIYKIFLDPLFWQALGNAERWSNYAVCKEDGKTQCGCTLHHYAYSKEWLYHWHSFIDTLAQGGTPDEFFEKILTDKK